MRGTPDALLFDFDGVLGDTERLHWGCWAQVVREYSGFELTWDAYRKHGVGVSDDAFNEFIERAGGPSPNELRAVLYPRKKALFLERIVVDPPILPETREMVKSLTLPAAVVSSSARAEIEPILAAAGIADCFAATVFGGDVREMKPSPEPYLKAGMLLGAIRPVVFEDSEAGLASGYASGYETVRVPDPADLARLVRERLAAHA